MWTAIVEWFVTPVGRAVLWSVITVAACAAAHFVLRYVLAPRRLSATQVRRRRRGLMLGLGLFAVLALLHIWTQSHIVPWLGRNVATAMVIRSMLLNVAAGVLVYIFVQSIQRSMLKEETEIEIRHKIRAFSTWLGIGVFMLATVLIWSEYIGNNVSLFLGIVGAGVALSMQETLLCIVGWGILQIRKPYDIGDRIEIDDRIGDVIGISVFQTTMLEVGNWVEADQSTGRLLITPNSMVLRKAVYNYTKGFPFIWNEFSTIVTFESDWRGAKEIMLHHAQEEDRKFDEEVERRIKDMQHQYAIRYGQLDPIVYTTLADNGVRLTLRFLSPVRQRRAMLHKISENILDALIEHPDIDFAYPTTRFFSNPEEGKPRTGGPSCGGKAEDATQ